MDGSTRTRTVAPPAINSGVPRGTLCPDGSINSTGPGAAATGSDTGHRADQDGVRSMRGSGPSIRSTRATPSDDLASLKAEQQAIAGKIERLENGASTSAAS